MSNLQKKSLKREEIFTRIRSMDRLNVINLPAQSPCFLHEEANTFILKTCQRTLLVGRTKFLKGLPDTSFEFYVGEKAYQFLLEIVCGLQSHLLAENEVTAQFKTAYQNYGKRDDKDTTLLKILEKVLKDAKEVRSLYLTHVGQQSYASLTRTILSRKITSGPILILGSGALAFSLVKLLKKKYDITLSARNEQKQNELCLLFSIAKIPWEQKQEFSKFPAIINTVGLEETLFDENFFETWLDTNKIFIDLTTPSPVKTHFEAKDGVVRLEDVFKEGNSQTHFKEQRVAQAQEFITELSLKRSRLMMQGCAH